MSTAEKKSTKIDIAPAELREAAANALHTAGMGQDYIRPIEEGTYDLEHLQVVYKVASGRQRGMAETLATVTALAAWARVYPVNDGLYWTLDGGTARFEPRDGVMIRPPSGMPFSTIGTDYAEALLCEAEKWATSSAANPTEIDGVFKHLRYLLAHRDHLHAQVGELQATNTRLLLEAREARAALAKGGA